MIIDKNPQAIILVPQAMKINYFKQELVKNISQQIQDSGSKSEIPFPIWINFDLFQSFSYGFKNFDESEILI